MNIPHRTTRPPPGQQQHHTTGNSPTPHTQTPPTQHTHTLALHCPLCPWTDTDTTTTTAPAKLRDHLRHQHPGKSLRTHDTNPLTQAGLHICTTCNSTQAIYATPGHLQAHTTRAHPPTPPRTHTTTEIIHMALPQSDKTQWDATLLWLHTLNPEPPPYRTNLWRKLDPSTRGIYHHNLGHVYNWIISTTQPMHDPTTPSHLLSPTPIWKLLILFDMLILHPRPNTGTHMSPGNTVKYRLSLFRQGRIPELYQQAHAPRSTPTTTRPQPNLDHAAQLATDEDNYHTAYARITKAMPVAAITPEVRELCLQLYPPPTTYQSRHRATRQHGNQPTIQVEEDTLAKTLQKLKKGTAAGPFGDLPDTAKAFALYQPPHSNHQPYLQRFTSILELILNHQVPPAISPLLAASHFMALHKDPEDPTKLRPISMGSALRRVAGKYIMEVYSTAFATYLLPLGQFGIALQGGMQLAIDSARAQLHRYIDSPPAPTRALLLLDLRNMFNCVSRQAIRDTLLDHTPFNPLVPFVDLLYSQPNTCYYRDSEGNLGHFLQQEGVAQGCPLGPVLASLVLHMGKQDLAPFLNSLSADRLAQGNQGDDAQGSQVHTSSYIDDTHTFLDPTDVIPFLQHFEAVGTPLGLHLNLAKTKLLTSTTGKSVREQTPTPHTTALTHALNYIQQQDPANPDPEITTGVRFLGQPLGSTPYATSFLNTAAAAYTENLHKLRTHLTDRHSTFLIFKACAQPSLQHLLTSDIYYHLDPAASTEQHLQDWDSPFLQAINTANNNLLAYLGDTNHIPPSSTLIAHHPVTKGGLGVRDHSRAAKTAYVISLTRTLQFVSTHHATAGTQTPHLTPTYARPLSSWANPTTDHPLFRLYNALAPQVLKAHNTIYPARPAKTTPRDLINKVPLTGLASAIYAHHSHTRMTKFQDTEAPPHMASILPSLLSQLTSIPLTTYLRQLKHNRLENDIFTRLFQRKLRLPILPPGLAHTRCPMPRCTTPLDPYGDHLFQCYYSKKVLSDNIRDTLYTLCTNLAPLADMVHSKHAVTCETANLIPEFPGKRPADIGLRIKQSALTSNPTYPVEYLAIDVTVTKTPDQAPGRPAPQTTPRNKAHLDAYRRKLSHTHAVHNPTYFQAMLANNIMLLPFTVDPFGGLGHQAQLFLYGATTKTPCQPPEPPPQHWHTTLQPHAAEMHNQLKSAPQGLFHKATKRYTPPPVSPTTTKPLQPHRWAHQCLALNLSTFLAQHLLRSIAAASKSLYHTTTTHQPATIGLQFPQKTTTEHLDPLPHYLMQAGV